MRAKTNTFGSTYCINYPGPDAYHFPLGQRHESPCMSLHFRSEEYQEMKEGWMRDAGILKGENNG